MGPAGIRSVGAARSKVAAANSRLRLAQVLIRQSKTKDAEPFLTAAEEYFRKANHISAMLVARMTRVDAFIEDGKNDQALAEAKAGFSESQRLGYGAEGIPILLRVAHMAIVSGDLPAAFAIHRQVRPEYERLGQKAQYVRSLLNEGRLRVSGGDLAEARTLAADAERRIPDLGGNGEVESSKLHAFKAYLATAEGKGEAALAEVDVGHGV